jgi:DNA topoisomerase-1
MSWVSAFVCAIVGEDNRMNKKGITRKKRTSGKHTSWQYFDPRGTRITDAKVIERCNKLVLPPAWVDVWISTNPNADLQATGMDAKGRRQYRYHPSWTKARAEEKFDSMTGFAKILPTIRRTACTDLKLRGMPQDKVVALIVRLIDLYHFRVGNDEYARTNKSYGLTTMKEGHVTIDRTRKAEGKYDAIFEFMGKSGKLWKRRIWEDDLVALIIASGRVGGVSKKQDLFRYEDETGADHDVKSHHINEYLDAITKRGEKVTAKDFRTWAATWKTAHRLSEQHDPDTDAARKKVSKGVIETVSSDLGNTPAVCATSYIHPAILSDWSDGTFRSHWTDAERSRLVKGLSKPESTTLKYLSKRA